MIIFASDLDNTLIHSYKNADDNDICVESKDLKKLSFMTQNSYLKLQDINDKVIFVPITTRSIEQYKRIKLLKEGFPKYAITSNGGNLIVNGNIDEDWFEESKNLIGDVYSELFEAINILNQDRNVCFDVRLVDEMFVFTKTENIKETMNILNSRLNLKNVFTLNNGNKIYVIPKVLTKGLAVKRIKKKLGLNFIFSAGDSAFDLSMLDEANICAVPNIRMKLQVNKLDDNVLYNYKSIRFADFVLEQIYNYI